MPKNVMISGLTSAGKTTHAMLTKSERGFQYVSASSILMRRLDIDANKVPKNFWVGRTGSLVNEKRQADHLIDSWVDQQLIAAAFEQKDIIFDSWGLPWLSNESALRIWLESSIESRCWKAMVSHGTDLIHTYNELYVELEKKDAFSREHFLTCGFDIFRDYGVFDYIIDISTFIAAPTIDASHISILTAQEIMSSIVDYYYDPQNKQLGRIELLGKRHGRDVFLKVPYEIEEIFKK